MNRVLRQLVLPRLLSVQGRRFQAAVNMVRVHPTSTLHPASYFSELSIWSFLTKKSRLRGVLRVLVLGR